MQSFFKLPQTCTQLNSLTLILYTLHQGSEDLCVRVWDSRSADSQPAMHISGFVYFPLSLSICPTDGGNYLATGCKGNTTTTSTTTIFYILLFSWYYLHIYLHIYLDSTSTD
jgi:hypothetical protein